MIGILPCAGKSERIHGLPKFLLPAGDSYLLKMHIDGMKAAGCREVRIGTSLENDDIVFDYADGAMSGVAQQRDTMTQTVLSLRQYSRGEPVLFGMPDTNWKSGIESVYSFLTHMRGPADVWLYCCQARWKQWQRGGMCDLDPQKENGNVTKITDKPETSETPWIWGAMLWQPTLWPYLHPEDPHVGYGVQRAVEAGLHVHAVVGWNDDYYDCGTSSEYFEMIRAITGEREKV